MVIISVVAVLLAVFSLRAANAAPSTAAKETTPTDGQSEADSDEIGPPLERLSVSYWPEYDKASVLAIYRGQLDSSISIPANVKVVIPNGKDVRVTGVSGLAADGQHDHDRSEPTKKIVEADGKTILSFDSYFSDFQFELYMRPVSGSGKRDFNFDLQLISDIKMLTVEIKKPVRATNFKAVPAAAEVRAENGFDNHLYSFSDATPGQEYSFEVSYDRPDSQPSIDPSTGKVDAAGGRARSVFFIVTVLVLLAGGVGLGVWRSRASVKSAKTRPVKPKSGSKQKGKKKKSAGSGSQQAKKNFCPGCGEKVEASSKFCSECGESM